MAMDSLFKKREKKRKKEIGTKRFEIVAPTWA